MLQPELSFPIVAKREKKVATTMCTVCGQQIPQDEINEHIRIELLDPRWKEKQAQTERNRSASNLLPGGMSGALFWQCPVLRSLCACNSGANVGASLSQFARKRPDLFGSTATEEEKRLAAAEEARRLREREANVWDGHAATAETVTGRFQTGANLDEQINALHRAKGLVMGDEANRGPTIGPATGPAPVLEASNPPPAPLPIDPPTFVGASYSAAPNPQLQSNPGMFMGYPPGMMPPPMQFPGMPPGMPMPPPGMFGMPPPGQPAPLPMRPPVGEPGAAYGATRSAEDQPDDEPSAKRSKKLPEGQYFPETEWLAQHPVRPSILSLRIC